MKKFLIKVSLHSIILALLISIPIIFRVIITNRISWALPGNINTVFLGASHIEYGINDSLYPNSINLADGSEKYLFTYLKLKKILESNSHLDTVFLQFAPTDIWEHADAKYYIANELSYFLPLYFPFFQKQEWKLFLSKIDKRLIIALLLQKSVKDIPKNIYSFGGFAPSKRIFNRKKEYQMPDYDSKGHDINYEYLNKIVNLCSTYNKKLYFVYTPKYNAGKYYDMSYFYHVYDSLFDGIELLDYGNLKIPDSLRADEHHLNKTGADYFTRLLLQNIRNRALNQKCKAG